MTLSLCCVANDREQYKFHKAIPGTIGIPQISLQESTVADRILRSRATHKNAELSNLQATYNKSVKAYRRAVAQIQGKFGNTTLKVTRSGLGLNQKFDEYNSETVFATIEMPDDRNARKALLNILCDYHEQFSHFRSRHILMRETIDADHVRYHIFPRSAKAAFDASQQLLEARDAYYAARYGKQSGKASKPRRAI